MSKFLNLLFITNFFLASYCLAESNPDSSTIPESTVISIDSSFKSSDSIDGKKVVLKITTEPKEVVVLIDDSAKGLSPITIQDADTGLHTITLKKKGYYLKKVEVRLDSFEHKELHFILQQPSKLYVTTEPQGASLEINNKSVGNAPYSSQQVKPGEYLISAQMDHYQKIEKKIVVESGTSDTLKLVLNYSTAYLDSVKAADAQDKRKRKILTGGFVGGAFALFGLILLIMEARE